MGYENTCWSSVSAANRGIPLTGRCNNLTICVNNINYWYCDGISDNNLVVKNTSIGSSIGGCNNILYSGNTNSIILGGSGITINANCYCNAAIVPNLTIYCTPSGSGNILCRNASSGLVGLTSGGSSGTVIHSTDNQIIFNNNGVISGNTNLIYCHNNNSFAIGQNSQASGNTSVAISGGITYSGATCSVAMAQGIVCGDSTNSVAMALGIVCSGIYNIAMGGTVSGYNSVAMASGTVYSGGSNSVAMAGGNVYNCQSVAIANGCTFGSNSVAIVNGSACGNNSVVIAGGTAYANTSIAMTNGIACGVDSVAMAGGITCSGATYGVAMGNTSCVLGSFSLAVATGKAIGNYSVALGISTNACGACSVAMVRSTTKACESIAMVGSIACGINSIAMAASCTLSTYSFGVGCGNKVCSPCSAVIGGGDNILCSGNTRSVLLGGCNITIAANCLPNTVIVPNLAIYCTPSGSGNILCWNSTSKNVMVTSGATGSFISCDAKTICVCNGLIMSIV